MKRREALLGGLGLAMAGSLPAHAADDYPNRPIRLIVPYAAGGGSSLSAFLTADALKPQLGQKVVIENRPGATGMVGIDYVAKSPPDGYTLLWGGTNVGALSAIKPDLPYRMDDFSYIGKVAENGLVVTVNTTLPITSMTELVAYGHAHPGKILYGTSGVGSTTHLAGLLLEQSTGMKMVPVPYKGVAESMSDLLSNRIQLELLTPVSVAAYRASGKIRFLGIMASGRSGMFPEVKTMEELGLPPVTDKATVWYAIFGPARIPEPVMARLENALTAAVNDPEVKKKFAENGLETSTSRGAAFKKSALDEYNQWKTIGQANHIVLSE